MLMKNVRMLADTQCRMAGTKSVVFVLKERSFQGIITSAETEKLGGRNTIFSLQLPQFL